MYCRHESADCKANNIRTDVDAYPFSNSWGLNIAPGRMSWCVSAWGVWVGVGDCLACAEGNS